MGQSSLARRFKPRPQYLFVSWLFGFLADPVEPHRNGKAPAWLWDRFQQLVLAERGQINRNCGQFQPARDKVDECGGSLFGWR
jgi:hypothetical protein